MTDEVARLREQAQQAADQHRMATQRARVAEYADAIHAAVWRYGIARNADLGEMALAVAVAARMMLEAMPEPRRTDAVRIALNLLNGMPPHA